MTAKVLFKSAVVGRFLISSLAYGLSGPVSFNKHLALWIAVIKGRAL